MNQDEFAIFHEIVKHVPQEVMSFFDAFGRASVEMKLHLEVEALNAAVADEFHKCREAAREPVLFKWFEVFRNIYIAKKVKDDKEGKSNHFVTFTRSLKPQVLLPMFWFGDDSLTKGDDFRSHVEAIGVAFQRFLYAPEGAQAWGAIDVRMVHNIEALYLDYLRSEENGVEGHILERVAAIALCVHAIATRELQLHIADSSGKVQLFPQRVISGVINPLLKYYHYDYYTQLSYAHEDEFDIRSHAQDKYVKFERQGAVLAAFSDLALNAMDASLDNKTVADAAYLLIHDYTRDSILLLGKVWDEQLNEVITKVRKFFISWNIEPMNAHSQQDVLVKVGINREVIPANDYFTKHNISTAEGFWEKALPIFTEMRELINKHKGKATPESSSVAVTTEPLSKNLNGGKYLSENHFKVLLEAADLLWNRYWTAEADEACMERWILSVAKVLEKITLHKKGVGCLVFTDHKTTVEVSWDDRNRDSFVQRLKKEVEALVESDFCKVRPYLMEALTALQEIIFQLINSDDRTLKEEKIGNNALESLKTRFLKNCPEDVTIKTVFNKRSAHKKLPADARYYVMLAIFANLIVNTITGYSTLWMDNDASKNERFSLFTHILRATGHDLEFPFHYHLGLKSDSYLRLGRTNQHSANRVDCIVAGRLQNESERQVLLMYLAHYLSKRECRAEVMDAIKNNAFLKKCLGENRIKSLATK